MKEKNTVISNPYAKKKRPRPESWSERSSEATKAFLTNSSNNNGDVSKTSRPPMAKENAVDGPRKAMDLGIESQGKVLKNPYRKSTIDSTMDSSNPKPNASTSTAVVDKSNEHKTTIDLTMNSDEDQMPSPAKNQTTNGLSTKVNPYNKSTSTVSSSRTTATASTPIQAQISVSTQVQNKLQSIRPPSWNTNTSSSAPSTTVNSTVKNRKPTIEQPGEATLPQEISYSPDDVQPLQDEYQKQLVRNANISAPLLNGWTLYSHQKKAILQGIRKRRMILALDMGLGKTLIGCVWAKAFKKTFDRLKVFVICPVSLTDEWKRTAQNATGLKVEDEKNASFTSMDLRICSWAKVPKSYKSLDKFVCIFDEAHLMQSMTSSRTKEALALVLDKRCVGVLLLTGTPMKNGKPSNLFPLLRAIRHPLGKHQIAYEKHFCAGMQKNFGRGKPVWDASGSSNLDQLKRLVVSNLLHLTKEQCLQLPPLKRKDYPVPISSRNQYQYTTQVKALVSLQAASRERADKGEAVLGGMQKLRSLCSFAKIGATVELVKKILEEEASVVIFTSFATVAKRIHETLCSSGWPGELLTGETPPKKRQGMVDKFQAGESAVFVCTFGAGGVGITLTAACSIVLIDRPWTPGETFQAEDRVRRIGQTRNVKSYWVSGFELDKQIDQTIRSKEETSNAVLAGGGISGVSSKINIPKLLHSLMAKVTTLPEG